MAGFRVQEFLYRGKILYVDDLVTAEDAGSSEVGKAMIRYREDEAKKNGRRFYFREGVSSFHFTKELR